MFWQPSQTLVLNCGGGQALLCSPRMVSFRVRRTPRSRCVTVGFPPNPLGQSDLPLRILDTQQARPVRG